MKSYVSSLEEGKEQSIQGSRTAWPQPLPGTGLLLFSQTASALSCHKPPEALSSDTATETRKWFQLNVGFTVHEPESLCICDNVRSLRVATLNEHTTVQRPEILGLEIRVQNRPPWSRLGGVLLVALWYCCPLPETHLHCLCSLIRNVSR